MAGSLRTPPYFTHFREVLFPNVSVPIFAFEQLPLGEASKPEGCDIHGVGFSVEYQLDQACACGRGGLETCTAQTAGEIETIRSRRAVDGALVGGDAIASHMDGMQAALFNFGDPLNHRIDEF